MNQLQNNNKPNLYLVTGATGHIGGHIATELLKNGHRVRALTRNPEKADFPEEVDVVSGNLNKPETVAPAFEGVAGVHFITINGEGFGPLESAPELVRLAEEAGVQRVTVLWSGGG